MGSNNSQPVPESTMDSENTSMRSSTVVGIDFGTTFSCIAVYRNGQNEIIPDWKHGKPVIPSAVYYEPNTMELSVGEFAEDYSITHRSNFVNDIKRLLGRKFDDLYVQKMIEKQMYACKILTNEKGDLVIEIKQNGNIVLKTPEEIASDILKDLKKSAEIYLNQSVTEAVIGVPAHFNPIQRKALKEAARLAGLKYVKLISEPVLGAIYYSKHVLTEKAKLLVFDFGGGTLDVSIIDVSDKEFIVRGIEGESFLGGRDIDNNLAEYFYGNSTTVKTSVKPIHKLRLKKACIQLKRMLSSHTAGTFYLDHYGSDAQNSLNATFSREQFEEINESIFNITQDIAKQCLHDLNLLETDIDQVVLIGGSTRIPKIRKDLENMFGKEKIKTNLNCDQAVALGAAIQAAVLRENIEGLTKFKIIEVSPVSVGVALNGMVMNVAINKNTPLPAIGTVSSVTSENDQKTSTLKIYEGERKNCKFNTLLGKVTTNNLPPGKAGSVEFQSKFSLDEDGILKVEKTELLTGQKASLTTNLTEHRLGLKKERALLEDRIRFQAEDDEFERVMDYRRFARDVAFHIGYEINKINDENARNSVKEKCDKFLRSSSTITEHHQFDDIKKLFQEFRQEIQDTIPSSISVSFDIK